MFFLTKTSWRHRKKRLMTCNRSIAAFRLHRVAVDSKWGYKRDGGDFFCGYPRILGKAKSNETNSTSPSIGAREFFGVARIIEDIECVRKTMKKICFWDGEFVSFSFAFPKIRGYPRDSKKFPVPIPFSWLFCWRPQKNSLSPMGEEGEKFSQKTNKTNFPNFIFNKTGFSINQHSHFFLQHFNIEDNVKK